MLLILIQYIVMNFNLLYLFLLLFVLLIYLRSNHDLFFLTLELNGRACSSRYFTFFTSMIVSIAFWMTSRVNTVYKHCNFSSSFVVDVFYHWIICLYLVTSVRLYLLTSCITVCFVTALALVLILSRTLQNFNLYLLILSFDLSSFKMICIHNRRISSSILFYFLLPLKSCIDTNRHSIVVMLYIRLSRIIYFYIYHLFCY